jgi:hypothetical protein
MRRRMAYMLPVLVLSMAVMIRAQNRPVQGGEFQNANGPNGRGTCLTCRATVGEFSQEVQRLRAAASLNSLRPATRGADTYGLSHEEGAMR